MKDFISSCILQIYRGEDTCFQVENLSPKSDYHLRVCAIRICEDGSEVVGAFSPVVSFTTQGHEPVSPQEADVKQESKLVESKPLTDQQWAMIILMGFVVFAVLVAIIAQQIIKYRSSSIPRWENQMFFYQFEEMGEISMDSNDLHIASWECHKICFSGCFHALLWSRSDSARLAGGRPKQGEIIDVQQ